MTGTVDFEWVKGEREGYISELPRAETFSRSSALTHQGWVYLCVSGEQSLSNLFSFAERILHP